MGGPGPREAARESLDLEIKEAEIGSDYFVTLRARIVAFGSHDMARAFGKWADAYGEFLTAKQSDARESARRQIVSPTDYVQNGPAFWLRQKFDPSRTDGKPGCLTRAVEYCASRELRKG